LNQGISLAKSIEVKWVESDMRLTLSYLNLYRGETGEALKKAEGAWNCSIAAERHDLQRFALYFKGRSVLMNNSIPESKKIAAELKEMIKASKNQNQVRLYHDLMGRIEMASKKYSEALEHFRIAVALLPNQHTTFSIDRFIEAQAFFIEPLANALYLAGDLDGASKEYESITSLTTGRMWYGDIYAKSFFMLGKIFKKKGMKEKAIANYQKFLDLWKDADPGIPEIDEARRSLAELRNLP
jgi:tetratricopeptide (TPR) repeat protein